MHTGDVTVVGTYINESSTIVQYKQQVGVVSKVVDVA